MGAQNFGLSFLMVLIFFGSFDSFQFSTAFFSNDIFLTSVLSPYFTPLLSVQDANYFFSNNVRHCKSIYSAPFYVYTAKKFPGMEGITFHFTTADINR